MKAVHTLLLSAAAALLLTGCRVSHRGHDGNDNVDIGTPFGSMHVKTNDNANLAGLGITPYPGATPWKDSDNDKDAADVNLSFGSFHLGVRAASYKTSDSQDAVIAFYKKDLNRYGDVIQCHHDEAVGQPTHTSQGLSCSDNQGHHHGGINSGSEMELRAGSPQHQHIVGIENKDGGIKIGLVALDLPEHHGSSDSE